MTRPDNEKRVKKSRVALDDRDYKKLVEIQREKSVSMLAKRVGLPYLLIYNVVHGRVKTVSDRHYRMLFGKPPLHQHPEKVDGGLFRKMVRLWLFLNDGLTQSALYQEYYGTTHPRKPDHRIFSGQIRMVDAGLELFMRRKFADSGIDGPMLDQWLYEVDELPRDDLVSYHSIQPMLQYLQNKLGLNATTLLNQNIKRYEFGELKRVSKDVYDRIIRLKQKAEKALAGKDIREIEREIEKIRESVYGKKPGFTLYVDIREELLFLRRYANKSAKHYLGRSIRTYETGKAKRITDRRAREIMHDCDRFIREHPDLPLSTIPRTWQQIWITTLLAKMIERLVQLLSHHNGQNFEKQVLSPRHLRSHYRKRYHGLIRFDMAPSVLGMRRKAFDLMVAQNCDIFRSVGIYSKRWFLPDLYLQELSKREYFNLISAKYEMLAKKLKPTRGKTTCMH